MNDNHLIGAMSTLRLVQILCPSVVIGCYLLISPGIRGRRAAFAILGALICYGCGWLVGQFTVHWQMSVWKGMSAGNQLVVVALKIGIVTILIAIAVAVIPVYWLRRELSRELP
jgi:hypothetical protein